jgi:hypothetical protein
VVARSDDYKVLYQSSSCLQYCFTPTKQTTRLTLSISDNTTYNVVLPNRQDRLFVSVIFSTLYCYYYIILKIIILWFGAAYVTLEQDDLYRCDDGAK